jgi:hypothetical protein
MPDETSFMQIIGNLGFPIAITIYLLHRFERKIEALEIAIENLAKVVSSYSYKKEG